MLLYFAEFIPNPEDVPEPPNYEISLLGSFESLNGDTFSQECNVHYSNSFYQKAVSVMPSVNSRIGDTLCPNLTTEQFTIISVSTVFVATGKEVSELMLHDTVNSLC